MILATILHSLIKAAALLGSTLRDPGLQVGGKMNFHAFKIREKRLCGKLLRFARNIKVRTPKRDARFHKRLR
jgi:hypothetical protein